MMQNKDKVAVAESGCFLLSDHTDTTDLFISGVKSSHRAKISDLKDQLRFGYQIDQTDAKK